LHSRLIKLTVPLRLLHRWRDEAVVSLRHPHIAVEVAELVRQVGLNKAGAKGSYTVYRLAEGAKSLRAIDRGQDL
jgi:hypothetical protein